MNRKQVLIIAAALGVSGCASMTESVQKPKGPEVYNLSQGKAESIAAKKTGLPLMVYGEGPGKTATYVPSGYMGDAGSMKLLSTNFSAPLADGKQGQAALKIAYTAKGAAGWAGVYWLAPANNWAKIKGAGYDLTGSPKLTFWAKGERGGERLAEVKVGGIVGPYPDTDSANLQGLKLTNEWKQYEIDLTGKDLRHIVGGFMFAVRRSDNGRGATFYLDEVRYEAPAASSAAAAAAEAAAMEPAASTPEAAAPGAPPSNAVPPGGGHRPPGGK